MPTHSTFTSPVDDTQIATYTWGEQLTEPRGLVQIAHGLGEHGARYDQLARALVEVGYRVVAGDHRGHGRTAATEAAMGDFGPSGFPALVEDLAALGASLKADHPGLPFFLLAHSMGSIAAQTAILDHSGTYDGVVLSGSTAVDVLGANLAQAEGPVGLETFNAGFEHRTGYEWLSRDEAEVDAYLADPLCFVDLPDDTLPQILSSAERLADSQELVGIRPDLPILLVSGQADPLAGDGQLIELLAQRYRDAGITDVMAKVYPDARHEIFNETNLDEITEFVIDWINAHR